MVHHVKGKRPLLQNGLLLPRDNARPHIARCVLGVSQQNNVEILPHPPYSPNLTPCDFWLFPQLKKPVRGKRFATKRKVLKDIKIDPKLSAVKLATETSRIMGRSVSAETVRNVIRHAGYSSRVARKKPFISLQNQKKRLEFAKTHQLKIDNFWKKVIFSDEIEHGGGSVMIWGCMASNGVENLVFIYGIMDHKLYIDILNNNLKGSAKKLGLDGNFIFQQDNDPKHTARNVKMWCLFHCKQQLHTPPQSPDIKVLENLWATLETAVQKHQIRNKAHLKQVLQEGDKISPDSTKKVVELVRRGLEDIIKAKEHATKY
ncbi:transposable element Tcb1 transposase [Trichonephila clavipes]|uniref:Transposable element Tcb1 transposase n=1 Tax=Trichonephila clavipes TaxID=2585209 RepID=A0A8X6WIQ2_TRICX|nr:transposable element Tcb1 transposase [Trichonephila clavipes]